MGFCCPLSSRLVASCAAAMPNFSVSGSGQSGNSSYDTQHHFDSLLDQLRRQSGPDSPASDAHGFHNYHQHGGRGQSFYGNQSGADSPRVNNAYDSPALDSPAFPPAAPTPPAQGFGNSSLPFGIIKINNANAALRPAGDDQTTHLLNLLKFSNQGNSQGTSHGQHQNQNNHHQLQGLPAPREPPVHPSQSQSQAIQTVIHAPAPAAADPTGLLAALMKGTLHHEMAKPELPIEVPAPAPTWNATEPPSDTQQYLLNLLNRPKPAQSERPGSGNSTSPQPKVISTAQSGGAPSEPLHEPPKDQPATDDYTGLTESIDNTPVQAHIPTRASFDFEPTGDAQSLPAKLGSSPQGAQQAPGNAPTAPKASIFHYNNPFEQLAASSPLRTPKSSTTPGDSSSATKSHHPGAIQILKKSDQYANQDQKRPSNDRSPLHSPDHTRRKLDQSSSSPAQHRREQAVHAYSPRNGDKANATVAEAVNDIAQTADMEAQEALARLEEEEVQAEIAQDLDNMLHARTEEEFEESAHMAARAIKRELDKEGNQDVLESTLDPELAKEVRDIVDEAAAARAAEDVHDNAHGPVADSWESEEIVVIEERPTVKVYNFPMKPWIAINVQEAANEVRPTFRDSIVLDIARLKKEFDQIDRNLVSSSQTYMSYAMSKTGGIRVIRQSDGADAKIFTRTDDRIFNVAMSVTPSDAANVTPKEAVIGTGVSGTVYWVQMKNGDKDYIDDHPEQHGFALPPMTSQEGDAPGGVLKTRARISSEHPEYFAVGRGKSINIIWPSYIFAHNLFKDERNRVVDTERLFKQCSLKINTGKAGKDFTFSPDDTTLVSLDKSGRVKFWDIRDLVAPAEDSDPRNPLPARTRLEIKEPLMTLTSTPEGEKAWPTSVLLLDKYRPYHRHTALRYMIVGMKQNHTLQLWDLALRKPVQEFNLPHSRESDAVCSVMYHPQTGMIVVGHPTRNSVYFLHLSAPKYALKNISQVDYIQRLAAEDSSIPQPESTAVISGIREYSFANRGILRSLDILCHPQTASGDDEQTLFELYAMHSKGVAGIFIKQSDLGWTGDNKVLHPVDAIANGIVKIAKLVPPPSPEPEKTQQTPAILPIRLATRESAKDTLQNTPSSQAEERKSVLGSAASSSRTAILDRKEEEPTPVTPAVEKERPEKRRGKKKAAATAAAAAERDFLVAANVNGLPGQNTISPQTRPAKGAVPASEPTLSAAAPGLSAGDIEMLLSSMGDRISHGMNERMRLALQEMVLQLNEQQGVQQKNFINMQAGLLQKVSEVLNENTGLVLKKVVHDQFEQAVAPLVRDTVSRAFAEQLGPKFNKDISQKMQQDVAAVLPAAVGQALQKSDTIKAISDKVVHNLGTRIDDHLIKSLNGHMNTHLVPAISDVAHQAVQRLGEDIHRQINDDLERIERQRRADSAKLDQLVVQTTRLSEMISTMATSHAVIQQEFLALKQHMREREAQAPVPALPAVTMSHGAGHGPSTSHYGAPNPTMHALAQSGYAPSRGSVGSHSNTREAPEYNRAPPSSSRSRHSQQSTFSPAGRDPREKAELDQLVQIVDELMAAGDYDGAMMRFLQSEDKVEDVFKQVIIKYNPSFVSELQPLLLLSVGATISANLEGPNLIEKIGMTEMVIVTFHQMVPHLVSLALVFSLIVGDHDADANHSTG